MIIQNTSQSDYQHLQEYQVQKKNLPVWIGCSVLECIWTPNFTRVILRAYKIDFFVFDCRFACFITPLYLYTCTIFKNRPDNKNFELLTKVFSCFLFGEHHLDYSYEQECIRASATLYSVPQEFCCEYARGAVTEKLGRMGECMSPRLRLRTYVTS